MANRVLIGEHDSLGYGLFVSKPTEDVTNSTRGDLLFSSADLHSSALLKILDITIAANANSSGAVYFNANQSSLGYVPFVSTAKIESNTILGMPWSFSYSGYVLSAGTNYKVTVTNTNITIDEYAPTSSASIFKCLVLAIPAS